MVNKEVFSYLERMGIERNETLLVHSSFSSLKNTVSAFDFLNALKMYLSKGTLILPALSYENVTESNPCFHLKKTKSCIGYLPEVFRLGFDVIRSIHPTHSVCALGKEAKSLTQDHLDDNTPCGKKSPFAILPEVQGKILMIGCGLKPNTSMHAVEEIYSPKYLYGSELDYTIVESNDKCYNKKYITHDFKGYVQRYDRILNTNDDNWIVESKIYEAQSYLLDSKTFWKKAKKKLESNSLYFVDEED